MPTFTFRAKKMSGEEISGTKEAANKSELARILKEQDYILVSYKEKIGRAGFSFLSFIGFGDVSIVEKMIFARNLSEMVGAGVSLNRGIEVMSRQTQSRRFKELLLGISGEVRKGKTLSDAMGAYPRVFSSMFRAMIKAGETSGKLEETLKLIARQLERDYELRRKVRSAFLYPGVIILVMILIGILMMIYVVPTLISTFEELEIAIPLSTRIVIAVSNFLVHQSMFAALAAFLGVFLLSGFFRSKAGARLLDIFFLRMPLISGITKKINSARTARTLGSLIDGGVNILEALQITRAVIQNSFFQKVIRDAEDEIQKGNPISSVFIKNAQLYPMLVGEMMQVGEETGKMSEMLSRLADFYEGEVAAETKDLSIIIEPMLMIVIGFIVGFFALSMITPLYSSLQGI